MQRDVVADAVGGHYRPYNSLLSYASMKESIQNQINDIRAYNSLLSYAR